MTTDDPGTEPPSEEFERYLAVLESRPEYRELERLVWREPERAWPVLLRLVAEIPDELLEHAGAGELENFVKRHASAFGDRIEARALADARFREALSHVWLTDGTIPADVQQRLCHVTGGRILVLPADEGDEEAG